MPMTAVANLTVKRGDTHELAYSAQSAAGSAINLSGRTYLCQVRSSPDAGTVTATYMVGTADAASGTILFTLSAATTAQLTPGSYVYDIQETQGSVVRTPLEGSWTLTGDVSRSS